MKRPIGILFVCMGNICRSPTAEAVMRYLVDKRGLRGKVVVDSAGTIDYHVGATSDRRSIAAGTSRGYKFDHIARQLHVEDFRNFHYIVAMDRDNLRDIMDFAPHGHYRAKISMLLDACREAGTCEVPDPYYGGASGFENVLDLVEEGCAALLEKVITEQGLSGKAPDQPL